MWCICGPEMSWPTFGRSQRSVDWGTVRSILLHWHSSDDTLPLLANILPCGRVQSRGHCKSFFYFFSIVEATIDIEYSKASPRGGDSHPPPPYNFPLHSFGSTSSHSAPCEYMWYAGSHLQRSVLGCFLTLALLVKCATSALSCIN